MRVFVDEFSSLDPALMDRQFRVTDDPEEADFWVYFSTYRHPTPPNRSIIVMNEPPLAPHRIKLYGDHGGFHSFYGFMRRPWVLGDFSNTSNPMVFPYHSRWAESVVRSTTALGDRTIYYAGSRYGFEQMPDYPGCVNLYGPRAGIVERFLEDYPSMVVRGSGWDVDTKTGEPDGAWRQRKWAEIAECNAAFVFALENCRCPNYVSEKLHDAFLTDRVALYLGSPTVSELVPAEAYVDLSPYFNPKTKWFHTRQLRERLLTMSQEEYDGIIAAARRYRFGLTDEAYRLARATLTHHVILRIQGLL